MMVALLDEAVHQGARRAAACQMVGLSARTLERWRHAPHAADARAGPHTVPANQLTPDENALILTTVNSAPYRDLSPHQIVAQLADAGIYLGSASTIYRVLHRAAQVVHRGRAAVPVWRAKPVHSATAPHQLWSWDITWLRTPVRGVYWYLYLMLDVWSRKIMGWVIHPEESDLHAAALFRTICETHALDPDGIVLHSDNGGPMKGANMVITLHDLGVVPSFSRPRVSNDNPFSEALFRTLKYCPAYPTLPFASLEDATSWMETFVPWYNTVHRHSGIRFVTPDDRHSGREHAILAHRHQVYTEARAQHPERWSKTTRNWNPIMTVYINPDKEVHPPENRAAV